LPTPDIGTSSAASLEELESDEYLLMTTGFLTPSSLYLGKVGESQQVLLKQLPAFFDTRGLVVSQHEAVSKDGTHVPYFQVSRSDTKPDGTNPTLLYGYGGFEVSYTPSYSPGVGLAWLEQGGVYVLANIRGGGEFGPAWHQAALKENRQRAFDDFIAIGEDLIARKVTAPAHLGIMGGSNGGLLVGAALTQRPHLFGAVVCQVPLLDMRRYHRLLAGASWIAEYGDPDNPEEWQYISRYSPYQNVFADRHYPRVLFTTSTRDDRVHPGHARKMAAKMLAEGHDVLLYENIEGGHGGAANNKQAAYMNALAYTFLWRQLR
jgi:prolyl oligopeptidase